MISIHLAGLNIGFPSASDDFADDLIPIFQNHAEISEKNCDFLIPVTEGSLPPFPEETPRYTDHKTCAFSNRTYHRLPNQNWSTCFVKEQSHFQFYVEPEMMPYLSRLGYVFEKIELSSLLLSKQTVLLHSSYIIDHGQAILFTAPAGTGKSTQADLWKNTLGSEIINGDRALIRIQENGVFAHGAPYAGTSGICYNRSAPIRAIVTLEQAPVNSVRTMSLKECLHFFYTQTTICRWKPEDIEAALNLWAQIYQSVPILHLACTPDADAVYTLQHFLSGKES